MEITLLNREDIDTIKWDSNIDLAHNGLIYAYSWYLDITANKKWKALVSDDYEFIMPIAVKKKFGFTYVYQAFFTQQSGVFSKNKIVPEIINSFKTKLENQYKYINTNFNFANSFLPKKEFNERANYILNLSGEYITLRKAFSKNHVRNINKSYKNELSISSKLSVNEIIQFKKQNLKINIPEQNFESLQLILEYCLKTEALIIYGVHFKEKLIALSVFSFSHNRYYNLISASNDTGFDKKASFFLFNEFIKDHAKQNLILDFEGSMIPGIARFFEGWGADNRPYYNLKLNRLPLFLQFFKK